MLIDRFFLLRQHVHAHVFYCDNMHMHMFLAMPNFSRSTNRPKANTNSILSTHPVMGLMHLVPRAHCFSVYSVIAQLKQ